MRRLLDRVVARSGREQEIGPVRALTFRFRTAARKLSSPRNVSAREYVIAKAGMTPVSFYGGDF
ncbi:hypothetical protein XH83_08345 [Bradyrhizobium sp. CCBAU 53351]|nr:hypothetical protein XH83_08345 [Bradyrhizobium sp. CCBAU 53351]